MEMSVLIKGDSTTEWWCTDNVQKWHIPTREVANVLIMLGAQHGADNQPFEVPQAAVDAIPRSDD